MSNRPTFQPRLKMSKKRPPTAKSKSIKPFRFSFGDNDVSTRKSTSNHLKKELETFINGSKKLKPVLNAIDKFTQNLWNLKLCPVYTNLELNFGRRRKSTRKGKKPTKALIRICKRYRIKVTRKVGKKKVYKSITVLKRLLKRKKKNVKKKKVRKTRRTVKRQLRFGEVAFEHAHFIIADLDRWKNVDYKTEEEAGNDLKEVNDIFDNLFADIPAFIIAYCGNYGEILCPI